MKKVMISIILLIIICCISIELIPSDAQVIISTHNDINILNSDNQFEQFDFPTRVDYVYDGKSISAKNTYINRIKKYQSLEHISDGFYHNLNIPADNLPDNDYTIRIEKHKKWMKTLGDKI